jgi:hypothetical protein
MDASSVSNSAPADPMNLVRNPTADQSPPKNNKEMREIGDLAVWTLSSAKQGHGVGKSMLFLNFR